MSNDWWARKLGQQQQQPRGIVLQPVQQVVQQPVYQTQPVYQQPYPQQQQPQQQPYIQQQAPDIGKMKYQQVAQEHDGEKISHFWKGGDGMRKEGNLSCPGCGSMTGFTMYSNTIMNGSRPNPHCFECGYNGRFTQADQANWA